VEGRGGQPHGRHRYEPLGWGRGLGYVGPHERKNAKTAETEKVQQHKPLGVRSAKKGTESLVIPMDRPGRRKKNGTQ
jgi:hypothetical protein